MGRPVGFWFVMYVGGWSVLVLLWAGGLRGGCEYYFKVSVPYVLVLTSLWGKALKQP